MRKYLIIIFVLLLIAPIKAQQITTVVEKVTTISAKTDERAWRITYWLQMSTAQEETIHLCDTFGHAQFYESWSYKKPGLAEVHSTMFCWVFDNDTIWANRLTSGDFICYDVSPTKPVSATILMDDDYLSTYYYKHQEQWPSLNHFGRYFVAHADLLQFIDGEYYAALKPQNMQLTYLSNDYIRIVN